MSLALLYAHCIVFTVIELIVFLSNFGKIRSLSKITSQCTFTSQIFLLKFSICTPSTFTSFKTGKKILQKNIIKKV